jgi:chromosome segregation protein
MVSGGEGEAGGDDEAVERHAQLALRFEAAELEEAKWGIRVAEQVIIRLKKEKETNLEAINRVYMDTKRAEARVSECSEQVRTLSIDRTNIAMELATAKAQLEKIDAEIRAHSEDTEGARDKLFSLLQEAEEKKGSRSALLHQQDLLIEKSRMRTSELERLTGLLRQTFPRIEFIGAHGAWVDTSQIVHDYWCSFLMLAAQFKRYACSILFTTEVELDYETKHW